MDNIYYIKEYGLSFQIKDEGAFVCGYDWSNDILKIPSEIECVNKRYTVVGILANSFQEDVNIVNETILKILLIPKTIILVEKKAIYCENLEIYIEEKCNMMKWDNEWNSLNRPVFKNIKIDLLAFDEQFIYSIENGEATLIKYRKLTDTVIIPDCVYGNPITKINEFAFKDSRIIKNIQFNTTLKIIGRSAFNGCLNLQKIIIPDGVETIENASFLRCCSVDYISLPNSLKIIGDSSFHTHIRYSYDQSYCIKYINCPQIYFRGSVKQWLLLPFLKYNFPKLSKFYFLNDQNEFYSPEILYIPDECQEINDYRCSCFKDLKKVYFHKNIKKISSKSFDGCEYIEEVHYEGDVPNVDISAFSSCNIKAVYLPSEFHYRQIIFNNNDIFYNGTLNDWLNMSQVPVDKTLFGIPRIKNIYLKRENGEWYNPSNIVIPVNIDIIRDYQFVYFKNLEKIYINNNVKIIGKRAFYGCCNLSYVKLPDNLKVIESETFAFCKKLNQIELPKNLERIEQKAFYKCENLQMIEIPTLIKQLSTGVFESCTCLKKVIFSEGLDIIKNDAFKCCVSIEYIKFPSSLKYIENFAFYGCSNLLKAVIPEGLLEIGNRSFDRCYKLSSPKISKQTKINYYSSPKKINNKDEHNYSTYLDENYSVKEALEGDKWAYYNLYGEFPDDDW